MLVHMLVCVLLLLLGGAAAGLSRGAPPCDEASLKRDAVALLTAHFDVELGAVAPGDALHVGFQHLKTADALLAAQAIAHDDFDRAALHFRNVLRFQRGDGQLPHLVYGGSVPSDVEWLASNRTFHPGPAFWAARDTSSSDSNKDRIDGDGVDDESRAPLQPLASAPPLVTSSVLAPPIAADVAWQIFQLSPYETVLGVVGYKANAVKFLCDAYEPLKKLQALLLATRAASNATGEPLLLASHHPWETFSPLSPHWMSSLAALKSAADYADVTKSIPEQAKARFAEGAGSMYARKSALADLYEPMIYLARCVSKTLHSDGDSDSAARASGPCGFQVFDTEFNSLALRSAHALVQIAHVLLDQSSVCSEFALSRKELLADVAALRATESRLKAAVLGGGNASGLWNATSQFFDDAASRSPTAVHSLRGVMPGYAVAGLPQHQVMGLAEHFLAPSDAFHFFCSRFPTPFFTCSPELGAVQVTVTLYNYFVQRAFTNNAFPGIAEYIRNRTRDMVCEASGMTTGAIAARRADRLTPAPTPPLPAPALFALAYTSQDASPVGAFEDGFVGSTLAAAAFLNILLPAVAAPPSPDAPPIDHRMLTVIMCIELVVAFLVALGCVFFSVYFVIKRPREAAPDDDAGGAGGSRIARVPSARKQPRAGEDAATAGASGAGSSSSRRSRQRGESDPRSSLGDRSLYSEYSEQDDLEEPLLSDDEDPAYGSFEPAERDRQEQQQGASSWSAVKDALAAISPW